MDVVGVLARSFEALPMRLGAFYELPHALVRDAEQVGDVADRQAEALAQFADRSGRALPA